MDMPSEVLQTSLRNSVQMASQAFSNASDDHADAKDASSYPVNQGPAEIASKISGIGGGGRSAEVSSSADSMKTKS